MIYALEELQPSITSSILNQILRFFFPRVRINNLKIIVSSEYFISQGDRTYSPSKAPETPSTANLLRFVRFFDGIKGRKNIPEMPHDLLYFYHQKFPLKTLFLSFHKYLFTKNRFLGRSFKTPLMRSQPFLHLAVTTRPAFSTTNGPRDLKFWQ